jgi:hypothetical protein
MGQWHRILIIFTVFAATRASQGASIDLIEEYSFQIPLADTIRQIAFGDIDNDGSPEVLARTDHAFALYSILSDSILFQESYSPDSFVTYVMIGDVNRDQVKDLVVGRSYSNQLDSFFFEISAWRGASGYQFLGDFPYDIGGGAIDPQFSKIDFIRSVDIDNDGANELLFSYDKQYWRFWFWTEWQSDGYSLLFSHFPDSIMWAKAIGLSAFTVSQKHESTSVVVSVRTYQGQDFQSYWNHEVHRSGQLTSEGDFVSLAEFFMAKDCGWPSSYYFASRPRCVGHLLGDSSQLEFLNSAYGHQYCEPDYEFTSDVLQLRRYTPGDTNNLVWERSSLGGSYTYHPLFPGFFLSLKGSMRKNVTLYRGIDAREMAISSALTAEEAAWNSDFPDNLPRVIERFDNQIRVYVLGISTTVESDEPSDQLPSHFTLGRPFPNPFNAEVSIPLSLPLRADVSVGVFNLLGQKVATLRNGRMNPGEQSVQWNAEGRSSGVYIIKAEANGETRTAKVVLLKSS